MIIRNANIIDIENMKKIQNLVANNIFLVYNVYIIKVNKKMQ